MKRLYTKDEMNAHLKAQREKIEIWIINIYNKLAEIRATCENAKWKDKEIGKILNIIDKRFK